MTDSAVLRLINVSKYYGSVNAVSNVSLSIERGEFLTLLGPSGSGKTTLLMSIAGFVDLTSGQLVLEGKPIDHLPPERRNFGMVFQGFALFPHMTVAENVAFSLKMRRKPAALVQDRVAYLLDLVKLSSLESRYPRQLSGGQQQRVALARALAFSPDVLLLDEPLSALDKKLRTELQTELRNLHRQLGMTFICVTHDQEEAMSMSDRIAVMREGRLIQVGTPRELYGRPETRFVADFLGGSNFIEGLVEMTTNDGFSYVSKGLRLLQGGYTRRYSAGQTVCVVIRPEKIQLNLERPAADNAVAARIADISFVGANFHLVLRTQLGFINVTAPVWSSPFEPIVDKTIWASWEPEASSVVVNDPA